MKTVDAAVDDLLSVALAAHGGIDHWRRFGSVSANLVTAGQLWDIKGIGQEDTRRHIQVSLRTEWLSLAPFGDPSWRMVFTPSRVAIREVGRLRHEVVPGAAGIIGERGAAPAEYLIACVQLLNVLAHRLNVPSDVHSPNSDLWFGQPERHAGDVGQTP